MSSKKAMKQAQKLAYQKHKANRNLNKFYSKKKFLKIGKSNIENVKKI